MTENPDAEPSYLPEYGAAPVSLEGDTPVAPVTASVAPPPRDRRRLIIGGALALAGVALATGIVFDALRSDGRQENGISAPAPVVTDQASPPAVTEDDPLPEITYGVAGTEGQFGDGAYRVGVDVAPGTYRQASPVQQESAGDSCFWAIYPGSDHSVRASTDFGSATAGLPVLTLKESTELVSIGCGDWVPVDPATFFDKPDAPIGLPSGAWLIGDDFAPGVYRTVAAIDVPGRGYPCMWSFFTGASHAQNDLIDEGITLAGSPMVRLESGESFSSSYCGDWVSVDPASLFQRADAPATISPGVWFGGEDFEPGTYEATPDFSVSRPSPYCSWSTSDPWYSRSMSDKEFAFSDEEGTRTVTVSSGEQFSSDGCGDWTRVGP